MIPPLARMVVFVESFWASMLVWWSVIITYSVP